MQKSTFEITKMDCPSEENLIRMKLDGNPNIANLDFDIPNRKLSVFHKGEIDQIEKSINELNLGGKKISTEKSEQTDFEEHTNLYSWMAHCAQPTDDEQVIRGTLGRLLFSSHEIEKSVKVISGGEQGRMLFGRLMLQRPNIMLMDEPTNHLDMESIESLNLALVNYPGTLLFVSHDREFISSLATRIIEITTDGVIDFKGSYDEYLRSQNIEVPVLRQAVA